MSLENKWKRILDIPLNRREFGFLAAAAGLGFIAGADFFHTVDRMPILKEEGKTIFSGWIETNTSQKFIQQDKGHFYFLREAILNNPVILEMTKDYFSYLNDYLERGERVQLGDALAKAIEIAHDKLNFRGETPRGVSPLMGNLTFESIHAGLFVFAAGFVGQWWEDEDLNAFGVSLKGYKNATDYLNGPKGLLTTVYPNLFVKDGFERENDGRDRAAHFAQHLLITFEYLYSKSFKLGVEESVPNFLKFLVSASSDRNPYSQARNFSKWIGRAWEYSTLSDLSNWPMMKPDITEGPFDPMVEADYKANELGAETAIALFQITSSSYSRDKIYSLVEKLNDKKFKRFETEPII